MEGKRDPFGFWLSIYLGLISLWGIRRCWSLNDEGLALLEFRERITCDPYGALANWNPNDCHPCQWLGVHCVDGKVHMLDLNGLSLEGTLAPELGKLEHLKSLVLCKNNFSGTIPKELGVLDKLELLDLRANNLTGSIPAEIGRMCSLKQLLVFDKKIEGSGSDSHELGKFRLPFKLMFVDKISSTLMTLFYCKNRKFAHWCKVGMPSPQRHEEMYFDNLPGSDETGPNVSNLVDSERRQLLDQPTNLAAAPYRGPTIQISSIPLTLCSGAYPAAPDAHLKPNQSPLPSPTVTPQDTSNQASANNASGNSRKYIIIILGVIHLVILIAIIMFILRKRAAKVIKPWKTGISGQLQKAFVTGVPKLNRAELVTACEDFSNIICTYDECIIYKGTLSSGVEIAVVSTKVTSSQDWTKTMERAYRRKMVTLSRVNHKNFVNLIGYCDEETPFTRTMVFEYAPNGGLYEHLHVEGIGHLDWSARMRIVMGTAYCLQYMHHDLNPPVSHSYLTSSSILLTDDYAAKIGEVPFGKNVVSGDGSTKSELPPPASPVTDIYNFGLLLLEIISGKLPKSEEHGSIVDWAAEYLNDKKSMSTMVDPTLQSFKDNELEVICEVIQECIQSETRLRPTMKDITLKLRQVLGISPDQAVPRLSPLWWAELEILSGEAT